MRLLLQPIDYVVVSVSTSASVCLHVSVESCRHVSLSFRAAVFCNCLLQAIVTVNAFPQWLQQYRHHFLLTFSVKNGFLERCIWLADGSQSTGECHMTQTDQSQMLLPVNVCVDTTHSSISREVHVKLRRTPLVDPDVYPYFFTIFAELSQYVLHHSTFTSPCLVHRFVVSSSSGLVDVVHHRPTCWLDRDFCWNQLGSCSFLLFGGDSHCQSVFQQSCMLGCMRACMHTWMLLGLGGWQFCSQQVGN